MPGNFPLVELRNFDSWIPTTDIDGIDAQPNVLADVSSMDFENGYIQNTYGISTASLPANITTQIAAGYNILSAKKFDIYYTNSIHTHTLFVMYKANGNLLKIYVDDTQVLIDGNITTGIVTNGTPDHINYNFANNSLKINLNCTGTFTSITGAPVVILNLSLEYIEIIREYGNGGVNLVTDGTFPTGSTAWTLGTGITIADGVAHFTGVAQGQILASASAIMTVGQKYKLMFTISNLTAGGVYVYIGSPENYNGNIATSSMNWTVAGLCYVEFTCAIGEEKLTLRAFAAGAGSNTFDIDNVNIYSLPLQGTKIGWILQPRWIGWQHSDVLTGSEAGSKKDEDYSPTKVTFSVVDGDYTSTGINSGIIYYSPADADHPTEVFPFRPSAGYFIEGNKYALIATNESLTEARYIYLEITHQTVLRDIDKIKMNISIFNTTYTDKKLYYYVRVLDASTRNVLYSASFDTTSYIGEDIELDVNLLCNTDSSFIISIVCQVPSYYSKVVIRSFEIIPHNLALVVKTADGQRGLIQYKENTIANDHVLQFPLTKIDWRVTSYEFYLEWNSIYYLAKTSNLSGVYAVMISGTAVYLVLNLTELTSTTLNYNYNLPFDKRVDNQRNIYSEVTHKGRVYFVNEDEKVYQSHISANGVTQPDAFPYDEDTGFGYFIVNRDKQNKALAVTPDNNLGIFTSNSFYVYFIQASNSGTYKQLKLISGSVGVSSINSIVKVLNGEPFSDGLFWCDKNGVYAYFGGVDVPINLIVPTHENYWAALSSVAKDIAVIFYNVRDREIWVCFGVVTMIYEIPYKKWKKRMMNDSLQEYCGIDENIFYYRANNLMYKYDYLTRMAGDFVTHRHTPNNEDYWNILQEVYLIIDDAVETDEVFYLTVRACMEGIIVSQMYTLNTSTKFHKLLMPLGFRFKSIYFDFTTYSVKLVRIKSLRYTYSEDNNEMLGQNVVHTYEQGFGVTPFGQQFGT